MRHDHHYSVQEDLEAITEIQRIENQENGYFPGKKELEMEDMDETDSGCCSVTQPF